MQLPRVGVVLVSGGSMLLWRGCNITGGRALNHMGENNSCVRGWMSRDINDLTRGEFIIYRNSREAVISVTVKCVCGLTDLLQYCCLLCTLVMSGLGLTVVLQYCCLCVLLPCQVCGRVLYMKTIRYSEVGVAD